MMGWVRELAGCGARRAGSPAGHAAEEWLADRLRSFGLTDVRKEPIPVEAWTADDVKLEVNGRAFAAQWIPYCQFTPGLEAPLVYVDSDAWFPSGDWAGKVVVTDIGFPALDVGLISRFALGRHDPDDSISLINHPATWVRLGWHLYRKAFERGAVGFIGILRDQPGGSHRMYAPYGFKEKDILDKPLPGCWVGRADGPALRQLARDGARARLTLTGTRGPSVTHNVVGEVRGESDERVVLHCHHDSPFVSPVEDASGCAVILALAKYFAAGPKPKRTLVVLFTAGHFYGSIGTRRFLADHAHDLVPKVALELTVEHVAKEAIEDAKGELVESGRPEGTGVFVPFSRAVVDLVQRNLVANDVERSFLLPAEGPLGPYPPTDGGDWYEAGVPLVNFISNPVYLLNAEDDFHWVLESRLPKVAGAVAGIVEESGQLTKAQLAAVDLPGFRLGMKALKHVVSLKTTRLGTRSVY